MACTKQFQNHSRRKRIENAIWHEYVYQRQTIQQLSTKHRRGKDWIRDRIRNIPTRDHNHTPQPVVAIADVTFFGRSFGICVIRSSHLKKNLSVQGVTHETIDVQRQGRIALEHMGYIPSKRSFWMAGLELNNSLLISLSRCAISTRSRLFLAI